MGFSYYGRGYTQRELCGDVFVLLEIKWNRNTNEGVHRMFFCSGVEEYYNPYITPVLLNTIPILPYINPQPPNIARKMYRESRIWQLEQETGLVNPVQCRVPTG